jgi:hypothetical protein
MPRNGAKDSLIFYETLFADVHFCPAERQSRRLPAVYDKFLLREMRRIKNPSSAYFLSWVAAFSWRSLNE